jgi:RNA polymerase sigma-70 factor (ECF subfamily)
MMQTAEANHTDEELVDDFKSGSMAAMEKIIERYEKSLFTFGMKMCRQRQDAEDVAQDTFMNAFRYLDRFRGETKLRNWLFKIAARACLKKRRKRKEEPEHILSLDIPAEGGEKGARYDIPDWSGDPSDTVLNGELKEIIDAAIRSLPHKYRLVFTLRDIEGFSTQESADILDISVQSVKTRLHRARLFLREKISDLYKEAKLQ